MDLRSPTDGCSDFYGKMDCVFSGADPNWHLSNNPCNGWLLKLRGKEIWERKKGIDRNNQVRLGKTDLYVNPICLDTNAVAGYNLFPNSDEEAGRQVVRIIENGINFIDTAFLYGFGRSEEIIGKVGKESGNRGDLVIATKVSPGGER